MIIYVWIVCLLFMGFLLLFGRMRWLEKLWELLHRTREGMDRASQLRAVENRHRLMEFQQKNNVWYRIEEVLRYSGLRRRMPHFTAEKWVAGNVLLIAAVFGGTQVLGCKMITSLLYLMITMAVEMILLNTFRFLEYRSVNDNILKCLNFLGNYSLTAGEITGVLGQVSKYMEEPLKGVMEECAYEAQMTGNSSTALLAMAEKVEHPKFKELARNLEISIFNGNVPAVPRVIHLLVFIIGIGVIGIYRYGNNILPVAEFQIVQTGGIVLTDLHERGRRHGNHLQQSSDVFKIIMHCFHKPFFPAGKLSRIRTTSPKLYG